MGVCVCTKLKSYIFKKIHKFTKLEKFTEWKEFNIRKCSLSALLWLWLWLWLWLISGHNYYWKFSHGGCQKCMGRGCQMTLVCMPLCQRLADLRVQSQGASGSTLVYFVSPALLQMNPQEAVEVRIWPLVISLAEVQTDPQSCLGLTPG